MSKPKKAPKKASKNKRPKKTSRNKDKALIKEGERISNFFSQFDFWS